MPGTITKVKSVRSVLPLDKLDRDHFVVLATNQGQLQLIISRACLDEIGLLASENLRKPNA